MRIKKGDKVIVITGKDKGKTGTVSEAFPKEDRVLVEGVNMRKKHQKARGRNARKGQMVEKALPIHVSNVMLVDPKSGKRSRLSITRENGKRVRVSKKSKSEV